MPLEPPDDKVECLSDAYQVVDNFLPNKLAQDLRNAINTHFADPYTHQPNTHQIWNYWFVPNKYAYMRTAPERLLGHANVESFLEALRQWSLDTLGLGEISRPFLSLYVPGCRQGLHNDAGNGRFAFVYSLTLDVRDTLGGRTIFLKDADVIRRRLRVPSSSDHFCEFIEPRFNRLIVFDDRLVHGVERVDGSMDPLHGRFVMHGHIREAGPLASGGLSIELLSQGIRDAVNDFLDENLACASLCHGPLVIRFKISTSGKVIDCRKVLDRVVCENDAIADRAPLQTNLVNRLKRQIFPRASKPTVVTLPVTFGGPPSP
jgi:hypothetical protein